MIQASEPLSLRVSHEVRAGKPWKIAWCHTGDSGGSKRAAYEMVRELAQRGHVIDEYIVRIGEPNLSHWPLGPHVRECFHHLSAQNTTVLRPYVLHAWVTLARDMLNDRSLKERLRSIAVDIESRQYDFVHIDHCSPSYTVLLTTFLKLPTVVYSHEVTGIRYVQRDTPKQSSELWRLYDRACRLAPGIWSGVRETRDLEGLARAGTVFTNSYYSKEALFQRSRRFSSVCRYGVDTSTFRPLGLTVEPMILSAGRIVDAKQHHLAIDALSRIPQSRRPRMVIATPEAVTHQEDPEYCSTIISLARTAGVEMEILRHPSEEQLVSVYNRALALVFVPIMEPFGLVALEAMACGTPVIGIKEGGVRESVVDGRTGILVDRDPAELALAIDLLVGQRDERDRQGLEASEYVKREWTWKRTIDCYESGIEKLLASGTVQKD
ncbi:glycosyl transferase [Nitrospira sp. KM1]|uniref:glycosyltransferase family 4 protein n=1 Tax=Nitrospira sp. KM1 TaxID=1936990 RepID=UPI0013A77FB5|nr:glycosyltransferase family 4 protein [Nitrospira sp. KM1]BCA54118.1 glycosyl transferase [Nitrospira sp. KM1]